MHLSSNLAAGIPPMSTVGHPGGRMGPPTWGTVPLTMGQLCISVTLAAGGIHSLADVQACFGTGAIAVQLDSLLFVDPTAAGKIAQDCSQQNFSEQEHRL